MPITTNPLPLGGYYCRKLFGQQLRTEQEQERRRRRIAGLALRLGWLPGRPDKPASDSVGDQLVANNCP